MSPTEQFHMILPSNSSMKYFPENTTSSFIMELPQTVELHGEWEVALSEIQFLCSFFHIRKFPENEIKFLYSHDDIHEIHGARIHAGPVRDASQNITVRYLPKY